MSLLPFEPGDTVSGTESFQSSSNSESATAPAFLHIPRGKLCIPDSKGMVKRSRITEILNQSASQCPSTIICGRSGTGKTLAVAAFASQKKRVAWNSLEPPDLHWASFANSTLASVRNNALTQYSTTAARQILNSSETKDISKLVDMMFASGRKRLDLLVFDNVHYVFDTLWFREFFELLLPAIPESAHVIFISRSKPPFPMWRLRSKQFVNLIDEEIFAFDESETAELFKRNGFPADLAAIAHQNCFGKVSQMLRFAEAVDAE